MPVGSPNRKSDRMMFQSGPYPWPRGNDTTHAPLHSFQIEYTATRPDAIAVPIAEPAVPNAGIGPRPRISTTLNTRFSTVIAMPSIIGVRASPADRSAPLEHEEHQHAAAEHEHDAQERQRFGFHGGRRVDEVEQPRRREVAERRHDAEARGTWR